MSKEALFRRHVRMSQIKYNLPMIPSNTPSKQYKLLSTRLLNRSNLWLIFSYKLDFNIKSTISIIKGKINEIESKISEVDSGTLIDPLTNETTELMLARQYEEEIDKLK